MKILDKVNSPKDLKKLNLTEKEELANELREYILDVVSKNGGHLASNLGVVELTIALHSVFNSPKDKIVWDVGHQTYVHKILTGRKDLFPTIRKLDGLSGFPKTSESPHDAFNTGHSSTSISVALGMARANTINHENGKVIAVIGDGSLTGGLALEALNDAGNSKSNIIVILNDNEMSISKNIGGMSNLLTKIRLKKSYNKSNDSIKLFVNRIPLIGKSLAKLIHKVKKSIKRAVIPNMYFEDIGFTYLGPIDGHNIKDLESVLKKCSNIKGPILIHVSTKKGKGYKPAEDNPDKFHGVSPFNIETGCSLSPKSPDYSANFGKKLLELASTHKNIVAVTAAMKDGTGLTEFAKKYPRRFFDVGIAEGHACTLVAGMASANLKPIFAVYSSFLQRGYDELIHDIALGNLPVIIAIDRAGMVGSDGDTHQGLFDMSFLSSIPNFTIMAPKNFEEQGLMLDFAVSFNGPIALRYPRGGESKIEFPPSKKIEWGKSELITKGDDITIIAIGKMVSRALLVASLLKENNINAEVINARFLKPFDTKTLITSSIKTKKVVTIEDGILRGGLSTTVILSLKDNRDVKIISFGYNDEFVPSGSVDELEKRYGLDAESIKNQILKEFNKRG